MFYIGVVNGGVWKTTDYGRTWNPIFDDQPTGSIGAIAVAPSNPNVIYVGSGEGLQRPDLSVGDGIYKSTDAGQDLDAPRPARRPADPADRRRPARSQPPVRRGARPSVRSERRARTVQVDRRRHDISENPIQGREHRRDRRRARSGEPGHRLRGAVGSAAGAVGERRILRPGQRLVQVDRRRRDLENDSATGLPTFEQDGLGRIGITVAPSLPSRMFATVEARRGAGLYRSDDAGESWHLRDDATTAWRRARRTSPR